MRSTTVSIVFTRAATLIAAVLLATGCISTSPGVWQHVPKQVSQHPATPYRLGSVEVMNSGMSFSSSSEKAKLQKALRKSLLASNVFDAVGDQAVKLSATVLDFSQAPMSMGAFNSTIEVQYVLKTEAGEVLFDETLTSGGADDTGAYLGAVRAGRARTLAVATSVYDFRTDVEPVLLAHSRRKFPQFLAAFRAGGPSVLPRRLRVPASQPPTGTASATAEIEELIVEPLVPIQVPNAAAFKAGEAYALVIGNNAYPELPELRTAVNDARAVSDQLERNYGFRVTTLEDASRAEILRALSGLRRQTRPDDSLLIYYAGHGYFDEGTRRGYWLPVDANGDEPSNWISTADISDMLRAMPAQHVMVVADSCYSGALTRGIKIRNRDQQYLARMAAKKSRVVLTSGGIEPVEDGSGKHSVFARAFLDALEANDNIIEGIGVFSSIRRPVMLNSNQEPEFGDIRSTGHQDGGDFLFIRKRN